jgi:cyanate lyase
MTIYKLYVMTHNLTGLKYLGFTTKDLNKYFGSGIYWTHHLKIHGYDINRELLCECTTKAELKQKGLYYSNIWNIVEEIDSSGKKTWANLKPEEGDGGNGKKYMTDPLIKAKHLSKINSPNIKEKHRNAMIAVHARRNPNISEKIRKKLADPTIYRFYHVTGIVEDCTRSELIRKYKLPSGHISNMIHERHRIVKGWRIA